MTYPKALFQLLISSAQLSAVGQIPNAGPPVPRYLNINACRSDCLRKALPDVAEILELK